MSGKNYLLSGAVLVALTAIGYFMRRTSQKGIDMIKRWERFVPTVYKDVAGFDTIGWGHLIKQGETFTRITEEQGEALLVADLAEAERAVNDLVKVPLNKNQFDALVSFTFNLGRANLARSTLLRRLNAGMYEAAAAEFPRWVYAGGQQWQGLKNRRAHEQALFETALA